MPDDRLAGARPGRDTTSEATRLDASSPAWRPFVSPRRYEQVASTNALLVEEARAGALEGTVLVAESQSAGRGRLGRRWLDPPGGSLLCSVLFRPRFSSEDWFLAPLVVSLAARAACAEVAGVELSCKWPNDLVALPDDLKVAGVLAEAVAEGVGGAPSALVVGIGLNCNWPDGFPPAGKEGAEIAARATSLDRLAGGPVSKKRIEAAMLAEISARWGELNGAGDSFSQLRARLLSEYRASCATLGQMVRVEMSGGSVSGRAVAVADDGRLVVAGERGAMAVEVGDVVHLRPSGPLAER